MESTRVCVSDMMQTNYVYLLTEPMGENFHPDFKPELTPKEMLELGVFGGKYMTDCTNEYPQEWFTNARLCHERHVPELNYFGVNASKPLSYWRKMGWIHSDDPRGWFQWYCRYYMGRRCTDDHRQIRRWKAMTRHIRPYTECFEHSLLWYKPSGPGNKRWQDWLIPTTGLYRITAIGAQGASGNPYFVGGRGAELVGDFSFTSGSLLQLLVGQMGIGQSGNTNGGGGGGTFVVAANNTPLLIAGGGGGTRAAGGQNGTDASITQYAYNASGSSSVYTPTLKTTGLGLGGVASSYSWGSGGAGFYGDGASDTSFGDGGNSWINGMTGGVPSYACGGLDYGGFGGGGSGNGCYGGGGGGGGYSGGDGGWIAGGGGSYNLGIDQLAFSGVGYGNGSLTIELLTPESAPVPEPGTMALLGLGMAGLAIYGKRRKNKEA